MGEDDGNVEFSKAFKMSETDTVCTYIINLIVFLALKLELISKERSSIYFDINDLLID